MRHSDEHAIYGPGILQFGKPVFYLQTFNLDRSQGYLFDKVWQFTLFNFKHIHHRLACLDVNNILLIQLPGFIYDRHIGRIIFFLKQLQFVAVQYNRDTAMLIGIKKPSQTGSPIQDNVKLFDRIDSNTNDIAR